MTFQFRMALTVLFVAASLLGQGQATPKSEVTINVTTQEVLLDFVVHDRWGNPVRNVKPGEVQVSIDGVAQPVTSFRLVTGRETVETRLEGPNAGQVGAADGAPRRSAAPVRIESEPSYIAIVFVRVGGDYREQARRAVRYFLAPGLPENAEVAIFNLNDRLEMLTSFTHSRERLLEALGHAAPAGGNDRAVEARGILAVADEQRLATATEAGGAIPNGIMNDPRIVGMLGQNMLDMNYQTGTRTLLRLFTMIRELGRLPGRKTVLYLARGLEIPGETAGMLDTAISEANKNNVSFYGVNLLLMTTAQVSSPRTVGVDPFVRQPGVGEAVRPEQVLASEAVDYMLKGSARGPALQRLSEATGGQYVFNAADLRESMGRIGDEMQAHYEITFKPALVRYDGSFRKTEVRVGRKDLYVRGREGYFDLPSIPGQTVMPFELTGLKALSAKPAPKEFEFHVEALRYRPKLNGTTCALAAEVPLSALKPHANPDGRSTQLRGALIGLVKDERGLVVAKVSKEIAYAAANERVEELRKGVITVTQFFEVPAGRYTIETAVTDAVSGAAATKRMVFEVEGPASWR